MIAETQNDSSTHTRTPSVEEAISAREFLQELPTGNAIRREIRTYGKRVKTDTAKPLPKRQRISGQEAAPDSVENVDSDLHRSQNLATQVPAPKRGTIQSYFKPMPPSSSPIRAKLVDNISGSTLLTVTPPSSPPPFLAKGSQDRIQSTQRQRRRLTTKSIPLKMLKMSFESSSDNGPEYSKDDGILYGSSPPPPTTDFGGRLGKRPRRVQEMVSKRVEAIAKQREELSKEEISSIESGDGDDIDTPSSSEDNEYISISTSSRSLPGEKKLTQTVFDSSVGGAGSVTCKECNMLYNSTIKAEVAAHTTFHKTSTNEAILKSQGIQRCQIWKHHLDDRHRILCIDKSSSNKLKDAAIAMMEQARDDLGGMCLKKEEVFIEIPNPDPVSKGMVQRYKVYIYLIAGVPAAVLLAERISEAGFYFQGETTHDLHGPWPQIVRPPPDESYQEYVFVDTPQRAVMLVDRIWTKKEHRHKAFATRLVDQARKGNFVPGYIIPRSEVAFSWPTIAGIEFATNYQRGCFADYPFLCDWKHAPTVVEDDRLVETMASGTR
ncbi:hypothetical protein BP5796_07143 [Coleophoma crateriformis]|uniref:N-acetyltransferase ESCO zinc-finger domain-containing protein n=1 Tax=Coleophoma crateriformis TaxID=565419 RepID=A0A3D8RIM8_9HELO|nr:hypothetical protein BP5796_07143 [Coleophoma crateriformis]